MCNFGFNLAFFKSSFSRPHQNTTTKMITPTTKTATS